MASQLAAFKCCNHHIIQWQRRSVFSENLPYTHALFEHRVLVRCRKQVFNRQRWRSSKTPRRALRRARCGGCHELLIENDAVAGFKGRRTLLDAKRMLLPACFDKCAHGRIVDAQIARPLYLAKFDAGAFRNARRTSSLQ